MESKNWAFSDLSRDKNTAINICSNYNYDGLKDFKKTIISATKEQGWVISESAKVLYFDFKKNEYVVRSFLE